MDGNGSIAAVNNWDEQFYATSLLLWQLTGKSTYEDNLEVRKALLASSQFESKCGLLKFAASYDICMPLTYHDAKQSSLKPYRLCITGDCS